MRKKHLLSRENKNALHTHMVEEIKNTIKENEKNKKHLLSRDKLLTLRRHPYIYVERDENEHKKKKKEKVKPIHLAEFSLP